MPYLVCPLYSFCPEKRKKRWQIIIEKYNKQNELCSIENYELPKKL
jgi:hypothetical protein